MVRVCQIHHPEGLDRGHQRPTGSDDPVTVDLVSENSPCSLEFLVKRHAFNVVVVVIIDVVDVRSVDYGHRLSLLAGTYI